MKTHERTFKIRGGIEDKQLKQALLQAVHVCGATIFGIGDYSFHPQGYTAFVILGESHAALHTFPENKEVWVELASCTDTIDVELFFTTFQLNLDA